MNSFEQKRYGRKCHLCISNNKHKKEKHENIVFLSVLAVAVVFQACNGNNHEENVRGKKKPNFTNEQFYDSERNFVEEKAKDALIEMLEYHDYPVFTGLREKIWVADYLPLP